MHKRSEAAAYFRGFRIGQAAARGGAKNPRPICRGLRPYHGGKRATYLNNALHRGVANGLILNAAE